LLEFRRKSSDYFLTGERSSVGDLQIFLPSSRFGKGGRPNVAKASAKMAAEHFATGDKAALVSRICVQRKALF
jgi:hypothetical protein